MKRTAYLLTLLLMTALAAVSCLNKEDMEDRLKEMDQRISKLEIAAGIANRNVIAIHELLKKETIVVGKKEIEHGYELELSNGKTITIVDGINAPAIVPAIGIDSEGNWIMSIDNGQTFSPIEGAANAWSGNGYTPLIKIDKDGFWLVSIDNGETYNHITGDDNKPQNAVGGMVSTFFDDVTYDGQKEQISIVLKTGETLVVPVVDTFYLNVGRFQQKALIYLRQTREYHVEISDVKDALFQVPEGWAAVLTEESMSVTAPESGNAGEYTINLVITSGKGYIKHLSFTFTLVPKMFDPDNCKIFKDFVLDEEENVLLDFSYAGYNRGESAPAEAAGWGWTVYDVTDYGAAPDDGISDRQAFLDCVKAATGKGYKTYDRIVDEKGEIKGGRITFDAKEQANAIIYFPEGEFILHSDEDNYEQDGETYSRPIQIRAGNIILRGAGENRTTLVMKAKNHPDEKDKDGKWVLYSSPVMLDFRHNSAPGSNQKVDIAADAKKNSHTVTVSQASGFAAGQWVCLSVKNNNEEYIAKELEGSNVVPGEIGSEHDLYKNGVTVSEYHQIKSINGNEITFYEPIHHEVNIGYAPKDENHYNWCLMDYPHYENVGIEDLTFKGNAKDNFAHHGSWEDDGAYKPLGMNRLVNSWLRRVRFTSVSEACSVTNSSNVSVYDIEIDGNRGHSSIRSQFSTRVFIGATTDRSSGPLVDGGAYAEGAGQYHAVGVSKPSIGTVLWRNVWGSDACFESHATQPRATLIDCCKGGWMKYRQGGDANQVPNHLGDLTVWNFESVTPSGGIFNWWDHNSQWWKFLPPVVVGFHGEPTVFDESQMKVNFSNGTPVSPESLYEAQLKERLGHVPAWLGSLK